VVLDKGPLSLVSTIEELIGRKSSGSGLETENMAVEICHADYEAPLSAKLALISPKSGGRSVGIVCSQAQATEFFFSLQLMSWLVSTIVRGLSVK
jgi:hypothetical protein